LWTMIGRWNLATVVASENSKCSPSYTSPVFLQNSNSTFKVSKKIWM
jgi:hypothetical protein